MGAAVVRARKSKAKRQVVSDIVDERKSSNCPFILAHEIFGILCATCLEVGLSRNVPCWLHLRWILIQTVKVEWVIRGRELEEKRPPTSCLILIPLRSLPCYLHVSLTKFYQVVLDARKTPPAEPHTKTVSLSLPSPFFSVSHAHVHVLTHTLRVGCLQG